MAPTVAPMFFMVYAYSAKEGEIEDRGTAMQEIRDLLKKVETVGDWWGVREYSEKGQFRMARNGQNSANSTSVTRGVMVEVMNDGVLGYAATSNLTKAGIEMAFKRASAQARSIAKFSLTQFDESIRPANKGTYSSPVERTLSDLSPAEIQDFLIKTSSVLKKGSSVIEASAWAMLSETEINYISSNGSDWKQNFSILTKDSSVTGKKDDLIQSRSSGMQGLQWGAEALSSETQASTNEKLLTQLDELLCAPECPSETMDLLLTPDQLYLQVHESIGHPLELDRILGDERNYAGWSFVSPEDFGSLKYGPSILNVTYDPTLASEMASFAFDDNGVKATKEHLIKDGVLVRGIGGIESQKRSGIAGVSCARATSWNRPAIDRMGNINIEPGESSVTEMISSTERGVLMETNRSWSIDDYRNKFQFGCEYGRLIENGELKGVVRNPNYRGATVNFWNNLSHVGNKDSFEVWGSPYCGKGEPNQIIRVGHAIPTCKFKNIEVFGGA